MQVAYDTEVIQVHLDGNQFTGVTVRNNNQETTINARAAVLTSGGFQADLDWLANAWGPSARNFLIRGTPYNKGVVLKNMLDHGANTVGDPTQCHAVAIDGRAPKYDGGIATRLDCVPFSVVVNKEAKRFYDEGEDVWPKRYAIWGRLVAAQPDQVAYVIIDSKSIDLFMPSLYPPEVSDTIDGLAAKLQLPADQLNQTITEFNAACTDGTFHPTELDGVSTTGLTPPKTNWARKIDTGPFYGYSLRPGVTFTYLGLQVDNTARASNANGQYDNIWAAGEIMAGSILGQGYLAGFGMTIGTVFGRIAGQQAAENVN